jgi:hypothetical protein
MEDSKTTEFIRFQINRKITNLYKAFLVILEDLKDTKYGIPDETHKRLRKKVLDSGNDAIREIDEYLDKVTVQLK